MEITMAEPPKDNSSKIALYQNPDYVTLYRFENPNDPYDNSRHGETSLDQHVGQWYTDDIDQLFTYAISKIKGLEGGRYVTIRVNATDLPKYDTMGRTDVDHDKGNYIVPDEISETSRIDIPTLFDKSWLGQSSLKTTEWGKIENDINAKLNSESLINLIKKEA